MYRTAKRPLVTESGSSFFCCFLIWGTMSAVSAVRNSPNESRLLLGIDSGENRSNRILVWLVSRRLTRNGNEARVVRWPQSPATNGEPITPKREAKVGSLGGAHAGHVEPAWPVTRRCQIQLGYRTARKHCRCPWGANDVGGSARRRRLLSTVSLESPRWFK